MSDQSRTTRDRTTVLVVDDEPEVADLFTDWLTDDYAVETAYTGAQALERLDDDVDVVLLDRRMPDLSGDDVLSEIRERGLPCRVALVTAVEPDFDIIEMGFDDYLTKPVSRDAITTVVDRLVTRSTYDERLREYFALVSKRAVLESEKSPAALAESDSYAELERRLAAASERLERTVDDLDPSDFEALFKEKPPLEHAAPGDGSTGPGRS